MVRKLAKCTVARQMQLKLLDRHREQQYNDRVTYWHSMDAAKYVWPRDHSLHAKEFNRFIAPKLTATAVIAHGHDLLVALSLPGLSAGSSRTVDILARTLERFRERGQDLRSTEVLIQGDNGPKEVKNNAVVRYLSMLVAQGKIKRAEVRTLMSGHTHEDIDSFFANLSSVIKQGGHRLHTPFDYVNVLEQYLQRDDVRPQEPHYEVVLMDQSRDWCLYLVLLAMFPQTYMSMVPIVDVGYWNVAKKSIV